MDEERFKLIAINYLLEQNPRCIAQEVPFIGGSRRADIVSVSSSDEITAYEIKSERDRLDSLKTQLSDYSNVFDYTYVVLANRHLAKARPLIPNSVGIILIADNGRLEKKRSAKRRIRLDKKTVAASIDKHRISDLLGGKTASYSSSSKYYLSIERDLTIEQLRLTFLNQLIEKYSSNFQTFKSEIGSILHAEDLLTLGIERNIR